jgi:hypothetical protein
MNRQQKQLLNIFIQQVKNEYATKHEQENAQIQDGTLSEADRSYPTSAPPQDFLQEQIAVFKTSKEYLDLRDKKTEIQVRDGVETVLTGDKDEPAFVDGVYTVQTELEPVVLGDTNLEEFEEAEQQELMDATGASDPYSQTSLPSDEDTTTRVDYSFYPTEAAQKLSDAANTGGEEYTKARNEYDEAIQAKTDELTGLAKAVGLDVPYNLFDIVSKATFGNKTANQTIRDLLKDIREKKPELIDASKLYTELVDISDEGLEKSTVKLFDLSKAPEEEEIFIKNNPHLFNYLNNKENSVKKLRELIIEKTGIDPDKVNLDWYENPENLSDDELEEVLGNKKLSEYANILNYYKKYKDESEKGNLKPFDVPENAEHDLAEKIFAYRQVLKNPNLSEEQREKILKRVKSLSALQEDYSTADQAIWDAKYAPGFTDAKYYGDLIKGFTGTVLDITAGLVDTPGYVNKLLLQTFFPDEVQAIEDKYAGDTVAETKALNMLGASKLSFGTSVNGMMLASIAPDISNVIRETADNITESAYQYRGGMLDNMTTGGFNFNDVADVGARLTNETIKSLPYMVVSSLNAYGVPVGLIAIGTSTATNTEYENNNAASEAFNQLQKLDPQAENYEEQVKELQKVIAAGDINGRNLAHSLVVGTVNSVLERFSGKIGREFFAAAKGQAKEQIEKGLKSYLNKVMLGVGGEGGTEGLQSTIEKLSEFIVQGKEVEFTEALKEVIESTLIGGTSGGLVTGGGSGMNIVTQTVRENAQNSILKEVNQENSFELYKNDPFDQVETQADVEVENPINTNINEAQILFAQVPGSEYRLEGEVNSKIAAGDITMLEGNNIRQNFRDIQGATNLLKPAGLETNVEAVNLMVEKKKLEERIEELKKVSPVAASKLQVRVDQINNRLGDLTTEAMSDSKGIAAAIIIPGVTKVMDLAANNEKTNFKKRELEQDSGINELLLKTIKDPNTKRADINQATDALIENNKALYYKAVGFDPQRGDISGKSVMDAIRPLLGPIIKNFDASKGVTWSTYVTNSLSKKKQQIYSEAGIGQQNISLDAEGAMQVADTQAEQDTQQDIPQRPKVYPSQLEAVAKVLTPEVRETQNTKVKDEIIRSINDKGVSPKVVATDLISKTREKEIRNVIKGAVGRFGSPEYNQFVDDVVNQDFINSLPVSTIKGRFGKLFGIEEISRTPTKNVREGKKDSNFKKQVFRIPKTTPETIQKIKDYFKANEKRSQSLFSILAEGAIVEEVQTMRGDTEFMNKLNDVLELKGSELNAEQFMDQLQKDADQRTKEDTSLDVVEDVLDNMIQGVDSYIESMKGTLSVNPIVPAARAIKAGLKVFKTVYQKTKSIVKAINAAANEIYNRLKGEVSKKDIKTILETEITQENVDNNTVDLDSLIDNLAEKLGVNRGIAYENAVYDIARAVARKVGPIFKVTGEQTEKEGAADFNSEIAGNDFIVELKLDPAKLGSVKFNINSDGSITLAKDNVKSKEASEIASKEAGKKVKVVIEKDYTFKKDLQKAVAKNKKNIKRFRDRAEQLGQDMKDFDKGIINKDVYNQLKKEGLLNDARATITMPVDMVAEIYQKKKPKPTDYINVKGKGLFSFNNRLGLPVDPVTGTVAVNVGYTTSGTIYKKVDGKKVDTGNRDFFFRAEPFKFNDLGKSKHTIDTEAGINKLLKTPSVKILAEAQKEKGKIANTAPDIVSDKQTTVEVKQTLVNSQDARNKAQEVKKETKGLSAFDFDDTLALTKEKVIYTLDGKTGELTAGEFAVQAEDLAAQGAEFDFSNFENVDLSTLEGPMVDEARKKQKKFGPKDIFVVTARPNASVDAIHTFLKGIGLNIPKSNITGLGNGEPQAKADWFLNKAAEGYNDFYFSDDSLLNVQQVKNVLDQIDVKSEVQQAIASKEQTLDEQWNKQIEEVYSVKAGETVSDVRARLEGKKKDGGIVKRIGKQFTITASAADFLGLLYSVAGTGRQGDRHLKFIDDHLIKPYNKAEQELLSAKVTIAADFAALKDAFPNIRSRKNKLGIPRNPLTDPIGVGPYTKSHAVRVYLWSKQGTEIPGIDQKDVDALVEAVENDLELLPFADNILLIQKGDGYPAPKNSYWVGGNIASDIMNGLDTTYRAELLTEWKQNVDIILSDKNLNKLQSILGSKWVEAIKDSISRQTRGSNRPIFEGSGSRQVNDMLDWLNASVGAVMFLNMRSGLLQLISNVNFINWGDNNIYNAAKAFASKEYVPTVLKLMNSDYLVNRRDGLKINVNEAELTEAANKGGIQGMISYLLDKGFVITRIMDSLAIATGGATFFINRQKSLLNRVNEKTGELYTPAEAETKAFDDFYAIAEETQQSSNPSKISSQQASYGGRLLLSFQNVTMQYNRKTKKFIQDLYNRRRRPGMTQRESDLSNISGVIYYVGVQNLIFNGLQQALFATLFDDDDEYKKEQGKTARIANGMLDSLLNGLGFGGAIVSTVKNLGMRLLSESEKESPKYIDAVDTVFDVSPVIDAKIRKLKSAAKTFEWNMEDIKKRGWNLENPAYLAVSQIISAFTNVPVDRVLRKGMNIAQAFDEETKAWQTVALLMGWSGWNVGLPYWGLESTIKREAEEKEKFMEKYKNDVRKFKSQGFTKRIPFTGAKALPKGGKPEGKLGVDYIAIERYDGKIQYYIKPKK